MDPHPATQPRSSPPPPNTPTRADTRANYTEALAGVRARRADERERIADERDRIADERDRIADEREALADRRERAADQREAQLGKAPPSRGHDQVNPGSLGRAGINRNAARTARIRARISREKSAGRRDEAARQRATAAAPYWPSQQDSEAARDEFLTFLQRQRETIAQSQATVQIARALCSSADETVAEVATARALKAEP
jgi:hypothetical protein